MAELERRQRGAGGAAAPGAGAGAAAATADDDADAQQIEEEAAMFRGDGEGGADDEVRPACCSFGDCFSATALSGLALEDRANRLTTQTLSIFF